jgi:DNA-binding LytR/AlgR family response regulator
MEDLTDRLFGGRGMVPQLPEAELTCCGQGDEAIEVVRRSCDDGKPFAVAFIDLNMPPGPDGKWTAEQIRIIDHNIQIVLVTGHSLADPMELMYRVPPPDRLLFVEKPFHAQEIRQFTVALGTKWRVEQQLRVGQAWMLQQVRTKTEELRRTNNDLEERIVHSQHVQEQLQEKIAELERFNRMTVDRELRMIELKQEVNEMARRAGVSTPYELSPEMLEGLHSRDMRWSPAEQKP